MGLFNRPPKEFVYSNLKFSKRLPIGTIITLKDITDIERLNNISISEYINSFDEKIRTDKYVIMGYAKESFLKDSVEKNKMIQVDYICSPYPIGSIAERDFYIREENIKEVIFTGFTNGDRDEFLAEIESIIEGDN